MLRARVRGTWRASDARRGNESPRHVSRERVASRWLADLADLELELDAMDERRAKAEAEGAALAKKVRGA